MKKRQRDLGRIVDWRTKQLNKALERVEETYDETLWALGQMLGLRDGETAVHSVRVKKYSLELAKVLGCTPVQMKDIARGAFLHDIGKIGVPDSVLRKPGPLTRDEKAVMQTHVRIGHDLLRSISFLAGSAEIVLAHHERFDGEGYPQRLAGNDIPLGARIFAVADTLDAMTSDRAYRNAFTFSAARDEIVRESGRQFDPLVVQAFLSIPNHAWESIRARWTLQSSFKDSDSEESEASE